MERKIVWDHLSCILGTIKSREKIKEKCREINVFSKQFDIFALWQTKCSKLYKFTNCIEKDPKTHLKPIKN